MRSKLLYYFQIVIILFCGCDSVGDCFEGAGDEKKDIRNPGNFSTIILEDDIHATLYQHNACSIEIHAGENLMDEIESTTFNNTLHLANHNVCKWARSYEYEINASIYYQHVSQMVYKGSGRVRSVDTVDANIFEIIVQGGNGDIQLEMNNHHLKINGKSGSGDVILTGQTDTLTINIAHAGLFDLSGLQAGIVNIRHAGTNNAFVYATRELHAHVSYVGNIYCKGDPAVIHYKNTGKGKLLNY